MPEQSPYEMVRDFHEAFKHHVRTTPDTGQVVEKVRDLRIELIREEFEELCEAALGKEVWVMIEHKPGGSIMNKPDIVGVADALADIMYVVSGMALVYGIDLDAVFEEVHRSNMNKLGPDGKPIYRDDGKVTKPEGWEPPNIAKVLGVST